MMMPQLHLIRDNENFRPLKLVATANLDNLSMLHYRNILYKRSKLYVAAILHKGGLCL